MRYAIPLSLAAIFGTVVAIADDVDVKAGQEGVQVDVNRDRADRSPKHDSEAIRLSELVGLEVRNRQNEDLGAIEDMVVDLNTGEIRYAAISMGGFLGIGDRLFAVPFHAITFKQQREEGVVDDSIECVAVVNINMENLENAQGFDQDNWPDMADPRWRELNDRPYRIANPNGRTIER